MMVRGLFWLVLLQLFGVALNHWLLPMLPASIIGLLTAGFAGNATLVIIGFAIAGIGISNMVPIAFSAGGNIPGLAPGVGLSVVTTMASRFRRLTRSTSLATWSRVRYR